MGLVATGITTIFLLATPLAVASGTTSFAPPYSGWSAYTSYGNTAAGCAQSHQTVAPSWSSATGTFTYSAQANASSCSPYGSYGDTFATVSLTSPTFTGTHGHSSYIYATWNTSIAAKAVLSFTPSGNSSYAYAYVEGFVYADLIDVTGGGYSYVTTTSTSLFGSTLSSTGVYLLHQGWTTSYSYLTAPLTKGHVYELVFSVTLSGYVSIYGGTGTGSVSINLAGSHGIVLAGVTVY